MTISDDAKREPAPPARRTTLKDVALSAGVSTSAVSRTFTEGASVSKKTREKVQRAADRLNYHRNMLASSLTTGRTALIGLVSNNFANPAFMLVFDLFTRSLQAKGLRPLIVNLTEPASHQEVLAMLREYSVDGVIVASSTLPTELTQRITQAGLPAVHAFGRVTTASPVNVVGADNGQGGEIAAALIALRGYRRVGFLGGPPTATTTQDRLAGFGNGLRLAGIDLVHCCFAAAYDHEDGRLAMHAMLDARPVDVVFCGDDILCMGALDAARERGLSVPDHLGLIGFNDIAMAGWPAYELTTIRQPISDIILGAVDLVVGAVERPRRTPETRVFACQAVERKTLRAKPVTP